MSTVFNGLYRFADFRFDSRSGSLRRGEEIISLSPKQTALLRLLLERNGEFVPKEEIFETVWADAFVEDGVLTQNIYKLRKVLGNAPTGEPIIENKTKFGYRITVPVETESDTAVAPYAAAIAPTPRIGRQLIVSAVIGALVLAVSAFLGYRYFLQETTVTFSRIESLRIKKVTDTGDVEMPAISPDGTLVVYLRRGVSDNGGIYLKNLLDGSETQLGVTNAERFGFVRFSTDGNRVYFRNRASFLIPADILRVSRSGGEAELVAGKAWSAFAISPDETKIAFGRTFPDESRDAVVIKDLSDGSEKEIVSLTAPESFQKRTAPVWSSDGKTLAFVVNEAGPRFRRIVLYNTASSETSDLKLPNFTQVESLAWLPNGKSLVASASNGKFYQLWEIQLSDGLTRRITNSLNNHNQVSVSADGKQLVASETIFFWNIWTLGESGDRQWTFGTSVRDGEDGIAFFPDGDIAYSSNEGDDGAINIWRINASTGERRQLTRGIGRLNSGPAVSADGGSIYFSSIRDGRSAVWKIGANGGDPQQVTAPENGQDSLPAVDSEWLYFVRKSGKTSAVFRKPIAGGDEQQITAPGRYVPTNFLALSPDGRFLAFHNLTENIRSSDTAQSHQIVIFEIAKPWAVRQLSIGGRVPRIAWTSDGSAFDFIVPLPGGDEIRRKALEGDEPPTTIRRFPGERLTFVSRSRDGGTYAVGRGRLQTDAILISDFD